MRSRLVFGAITAGALVGAAFSVRAQAATRMSPADVESQVRSAGARAALVKLYDTEAWSTSILPGVGSGSIPWIRVAEQLKQAADGAAAEDLDIALRLDALSAAPLRVLPELSRIYGESVENICHVSFEAESPKPDIATYLRNIRAKLSMARSVRTRDLADACKRGLEMTESDARAQGIL